MQGKANSVRKIRKCPIHDNRSEAKVGKRTVKFSKANALDILSFFIYCMKQSTSNETRRRIAGAKLKRTTSSQKLFRVSLHSHTSRFLPVFPEYLERHSNLHSLVGDLVHGAVSKELF